MVAATSKREQGNVQCVVCDRHNCEFDAMCGRCMAPAELTKSVTRRGAPPQFLAVLGESAAGKTVYLGMLLDILSKGYKNLRGFPNGAFSVTVQQQTMAALQDRLFPEKTASEADQWRWVHCEVSSEEKRNEYVDVITPDFAGEAIALEVETPGTYPTIRSVIRKASSLMVLIDSQLARDSGRDEDYFGMKLASYISNLHDNGNAHKKLSIPICVLFTKADACPEAKDDPAAFAAANLPGLTNFCERHFAKHTFFATGVAGGIATVTSDHGFRLKIPLHIEPHGVIEPLQWIMKNL